MFLVGALGFTASSVAIGLSSSLGWVVALRAVQGVFGALMQPATLGLLRSAFPEDRLNQPIAVRSAVIAASTAAGPVVGGLLVEHAYWGWVFFLNVPLGAIALVLGVTVLSDVRKEAAGGRLDLVGMLLVAGALGSLVWGLAVMADAGWTAPEALYYLAAGAVLGAAFVAWERRNTDPLVPLRLFRSAPFTSGVVTMAVMGCVMVGAPFVLIFYLQNVLGLSPSESGVRVLSMTLLMIVGAPPAAMWIGRAGPRIPVAVGLTVIAMSMCALAGLDADSGTPQLILCFLLLGLGFSPVMVGGTKLVLSNAPKELSGVAERDTADGHAGRGQPWHRGRQRHRHDVHGGPVAVPARGRRSHAAVGPDRGGRTVRGRRAAARPRHRHGRPRCAGAGRPVGVPRRNAVRAAGHGRGGGTGGRRGGTGSAGLTGHDADRDCPRVNQPKAPVVSARGSPTVHLAEELALFRVESEEWLTVFRLPSHAPEFHPQDGVWSLVDQGLSNFAAMRPRSSARRHEAQAQEDPVPGRADRWLAHRDRIAPGCRRTH